MIDWTWLIPITATAAMLVMAATPRRGLNLIDEVLTSILQLLWIIPISLTWTIFFAVKWWLGQ